LKEHGVLCLYEGHNRCVFCHHTSSTLEKW
jgi:hypothetical protein